MEIIRSCAEEKAELDLGDRYGYSIARYYARTRRVALWSSGRGFAAPNSCSRAARAAATGRRTRRPVQLARCSRAAATYRRLLDVIIYYRRAERS